MGTPSPSSTPRTSSGASCNGSTPRTARPANCPLRCARKASCTFIPTASAFSVASAKTPRRTAWPGSIWTAAPSRRSKGFRRTGRRRECRWRSHPTANGCSTRCTRICRMSRPATTARTPISGNSRLAAELRSSSRAGSRAFTKSPGMRKAPAATSPPTSARRTMISGASRSPTRSATRKSSPRATPTKTGLRSRAMRSCSSTRKTTTARPRWC